METRKKVIVFGIFDGIHEGHRDFLRQARMHGDILVVIVGRDSVSKKLKGKVPKYSEEERRKLVEEVVDKAVLGDIELSTYAVLQDLRPDVICIGYDQEELEKDLAKWLKNEKKVKVIKLHVYQPDMYHSSLLK